MLSSARFDPAAPAIHVWALRLDAPGVPTALLEAVLSDDERERAGRYTAATARHEFTATRATLRALLAGYLNTTPQGLRFGTAARGKPVLDSHPGIAFNVSHSGGVALLAFAPGGEVGVDVEALRPLPEVDALAERIFNPPDLQRWRALPADGREPAFYRAWTRKEACAKAGGDGLWADLRQIDTDGLSLWCLQEIDVGDGHAAALACRAPGLAVAPLRWVGSR